MIEGLKCVGDILGGVVPYTEGRDALISEMPWSDLGKCIPLIITGERWAKVQDGYPVYEELAGSNVILEFFSMKDSDGRALVINRYKRLSPISTVIEHRYDLRPDGSVYEYDVIGGEAESIAYHESDDKMSPDQITRFIVDNVLEKLNIER